MGLSMTILITKRNLAFRVHIPESPRSTTNETPNGLMFKIIRALLAATKYRAIHCIHVRLDLLVVTPNDFRVSGVSNVDSAFIISVWANASPSLLKACSASRSHDCSH